ncbi:MAG: 3-hydroxyacyl-CoA dehydrogenase family protein [Ignavibacteriales bacterium]|nr:3-hydroxyacyl-CoA dehydrogenase family protein [Ignavibacteriales bacterium]
MKKKAPVRARAHENAGPDRTAVYIIGDWQIVAEFVPLCISNGFFVYFDFNTVPDNAPAFDPELSRKSAQIPRDISFALELTNLDLEQKRKNLTLLDKTLLPTTAIASSSVTVSATEQSSWITHKGRLVGCAALPSISFKPLIEIAPTAFTPTGTVSVVQRFFRSIGKEIELVQDRVGMVFPRIVCQMINEAAFALQEEIAAPQDIDAAMKTGARYPLGPIEWADRIGLEHVHAVLKALHGDLGEDRYCIAPLLKQMAVSGTWWRRTQAHNDERLSV